MQNQLNDTQTRIIGSLIEKSIVTPDQYPMTLNALTNACNQKSSRDPVMSLTPGEVQHTIRELEDMHLVQTNENFKSRVEKYSQRFCNTRYSDLQFSDAELAVVCLLLLRGPQTPGELRARSGRLHTFADNTEVVQALSSLAQRETGALAVKLPRTPGRKDSEFMHQFSGPIDIEAHASKEREPPTVSSARRRNLGELEKRVSDLEAEVAALKAKLGHG